MNHRRTIGGLWARAMRFVVYGFLGWFESFDSVWQTTLICFGATAVEDAFPRMDPGHLVFLLVLSLYATFTQNGLAHVNALTSAKLDRALDQLNETSATLLQLAKNETAMQEALIVQTEAIAAAMDARKKPRR